MYFYFNILWTFIATGVGYLLGVATPGLEGTDVIAALFVFWIVSVLLHNVYFDRRKSRG